jgi:hypothetical protein
MQALLPTDTPAATLPLPPTTLSSQALGSDELQRLRDSLRLAYGPVEAPLPARLAELAERLARREQAED